ncbi:hypothetical protein Ocin01_01312 [Orchesella cincta]|uniref:Uncharacterized protein n=1 Tax=Orchesella cincta TaxID=48709 RepID=A0A1D2NJC2_ORCCI|nr:hypothetical protein Ocin01_01312 [Orchesella cincta]
MGQKVNGPSFHVYSYDAISGYIRRSKKAERSYRLQLFLKKHLKTRPPLEAGIPYQTKTMKAFVVLAVLGVATAAPQYGYGGDCYTWFLPPDFKEIPCKIELTHDVITYRWSWWRLWGWSRRRIWGWSRRGLWLRRRIWRWLGCPMAASGGMYDQGASNFAANQGSNLNAYGAQGSQGSALNAANSQYGAAAQAQGSGLAARNAGASSNYGNKFGSSQTFGESYGNSNAYDNSLAAQQGSQAAAQYGQANSLNAAQGSQGSVGALNAGQYSNAAGSAMHNAGAGYGVVG